MGKYNNKSVMVYGLRGEKGDKGPAIESIELVGQDKNGGNIYRMTYENGDGFEFTAPKGDSGEVVKETIKKFINFFEFEQIETEIVNGFYNCRTGVFTENPSYRSAKIPVSNGEIFSVTGQVYRDNVYLALITYLDSNNTVIGTEFKSITGATEHALYTDEIIIIPPNVAYIAMTSYGKTPVIKKIKDKNILEYVKEIKDETACSFDKFYEYDTDSWDGVDITPETRTYTTGAIWEKASLVTTTATAKYNALNEAMEVVAGATYKILNFFGGAVFTDTSHSINRQKNCISNVQDFEFVVPDGCSEMRLFIHPSFITDIDKVIRITPVTDEEKALCKIKIPQLSIDTEATQFKGKTIVNFGDSIFGNTRPPSDISTKLAELTGATVYNCGFGGCRMSKHSIVNFDAFSMYSLANSIATQDFSLQDTAIANSKTATTEAEGKLPTYFETSLDLLKSIDFSKVDIITIAYGTNDYTGGKNLDSDTETHSTNTLAGALRYSIETLLATYPQLKIFLCTPTWRFWQTSGTYTEDSDTKTFSGGKLTDYVDKIKAVGLEYHLKVIDNYHELGINKFNCTNYFPTTDGTHHNQNGRNLIARHITKELF